MEIIEINNINEKELLPGFKVRFVHTENVTLAYWYIKAGSVLPQHAHIHEQVSQVIDGEFELTVNGKKYHLSSGKIAVIPSNIEHSGVAITDCKIVDTFYPIREDYR